MAPGNDGTSCGAMPPTEGSAQPKLNKWCVCECDREFACGAKRGALCKLPRPWGRAWRSRRVPTPRHPRADHRNGGRLMSSDSMMIRLKKMMTELAASLSNDEGAAEGRVRRPERRGGRGQKKGKHSARKAAGCDRALIGQELALGCGCPRGCLDQHSEVPSSRRARA